MSFEFTGTIKKIGEVQQVTASFAKRELVVLMDGQYPQYILLEFSQNRMELLDKFKEGEYVKVSFDLRGREWLDPKTNQARYFNSLTGWKIEVATPGVQATTAASAPTYATQTEAPANPFNQNSAAQQPVSSTQGDPDDLPF